ncbi:ERF family protein [Tsukamurella soli]|uniref:ERF family protein n=1 Tax=Tsukamurella soli TaxID=644556 RepID=A0ABP8JIR1_9ACTN
MANIIQLLSAVSTDVGAVSKGDRNNSPGGSFNFRGIDRVVNATHPAFTTHQVVVVPSLLAVNYDEYTTTQGKRQSWVKVQVMYTFYGPEGDKVEAVVPGEAGDSADKGTAKAMSVALRTALLQVLNLPTSEEDPDATTVERGNRPPEPNAHAQQVDPGEKRRLDLAEQAIELCKANNVSAEASRKLISDVGGSGKVREQSEDVLNKLVAALMQIQMSNQQPEQQTLDNSEATL